MTLGSLFDGVGGWQLAAVRADIEPIWSSEIDKYCRQITAKHFPNTIQLGDITKIDSPPYVDIITAGFPCVDVSIAGNRAGLAGKRSGLFYDAVRLIRRIKPKYAIFENVVGLLNSNGGVDFHAVLEQIAETEISICKRWANAGLVDCRDRQIAWRICDAQYWGCAQRRQRVFIVCSFGNRRAAEILFECESLCRDTSTRQKQEQRTSRAHFEGVDYAIFDMTHADEVLRRVKGDKVNCLNARMGTGGNQVPLVVYGIGRDAFNCGENAKFGLSLDKELQPPLTARGAGALFDGYVVRRLTPRECERLQGLPDDWTAGVSDTQRYKMIGNGMAQPIADWILRQVIKND